MENAPQRQKLGFGTWIICAFSLYFIWHVAVGGLGSRLFPKLSHTLYEKYDSLTSLSASFSYTSISGFILIATVTFLILLAGEKLSRNQERRIFYIPTLLACLVSFFLDFTFILVIARVLDSSHSPFLGFYLKGFLNDTNGHPIVWTVIVIVAAGSVASVFLIRKGLGSIEEEIARNQKYEIVWYSVLVFVPLVLLFMPFGNINTYQISCFAFYILQIPLQLWLYSKRRLDRLIRRVALISMLGVISFLTIFMTFFSAALVNA